MRLLIAGGDRRFACAAEEACLRGEDVITVGLERAEGCFPRVGIQEIASAEAVIMANPWRGQLPGSLGGSGLTAESVLAATDPSAQLFLPDDTGKPASFDRPYMRPEEDYVLANAHLTAEGAVHALMSRADFALSGEKALLIGWGRIARRLAFLLKGLGVEVCAAARREEARAEAAQSGYEACPMEEMEARLRRYRLIVNTVPARVLDDGRLERIGRDVVLIDLASAPYGFSLEKAEALGLNAARENGLPGRYCPRTAGRVMLDAAMAAFSERRST